MPLNLSVMKAVHVVRERSHFTVMIVDVDREVRVKHASIALQCQLMIFTESSHVQESAVFIMVVSATTLAPLFQDITSHLQLMREIVSACIS